jgi:dihydroorotate dehydrogenase electron transfer subunit
MSALRADDRVRVLGPLGNSFPVLEKKKILIVAGGRGIAPLYYAIKSYISDNDIYLIYGARTKDDLNLLDQLEKLPLKEMYLYTDDGSLGREGLVTRDIREIILGKKIDISLSCGPDPMFKSIFNEIAGLKVENYVSLEALMGCGFGVCHSCVVKTINNDYKKVCSEGPVFRMEEIEW